MGEVIRISMFKKSLITKTLIILIPVVTISQVVVFSYQAWKHQEQRVSEQITNLEELLDVESVAFVRPVWEYDDDATKKLLDGIMHLPNIEAVSIYDADSKIVKSRGDVEAIPDIPGFRGRRDITREMSNGKEFLGTLQITVNDRVITDELKEYLKFNGLIFLTLMLVLVVALFVTIRLFVSRPLQMLMYSIREAKSHKQRLEVSWQSRDELGEVIEAYNEMLQAQAAAEKEIRDHQENLEKQISDRTADLEKSRAQTQMILDASPIGVAFSAEGIIHFANPKFEEMFGVSVGGASPGLYVSPDEREILMKRLSSGEKVINYELQMYDKNKKIRDMIINYLPVNYEGKDGFLGWLLDITDRKKDERELKNKFNELERFRSLAVGREEKMIGLKEEINFMLKGAGKQPQYKISEKEKGTDINNFAEKSLPGSFIDIEEQKNIENDLQSQVDELSRIQSAMLNMMEDLDVEKNNAEAANRAKSLFLANMSHELRTPLNAILGFSGMLTREKYVDSDAIEKLSIINRSGLHLLSMINDVLDLSKIEAERIELKNDVFDLVALIEETAVMIRTRAGEKGIDLETQTESIHFPYIKADVGKLRQILINLLGNAVKFTDEGGVTVRAFTEPDPEESNRCQIVIEVEDTGLGIDPSKKEDIFYPFVQHRDVPERKGTGLGLSICKRYAEIMGGTVEVESEKGKGSIFRVRIPAQIAGMTEVKSSAADKPRVIGLPPAQKPKRILIADDNRENMLLLKSLLEDVGLRVIEAQNGKEAVEAFKKESPDFIWMDMRMPVMDGYEAVRYIRELPGGEKVPISGITASVFHEQKQDILAAGCDEVVYKPFQEHEIFEVMARLLNIEYIYEQEQNKAPGKLSQTELTAKLATIPNDLLQDLAQATLVLDREAALDIISCIAARNPEVAGGLKDFVDNFKMTRLRTLLEKANKRAN